MIDDWVPDSTPKPMIMGRIANLRVALAGAPDEATAASLEFALREAQHALYRADYVRQDENGALYYADGYDHLFFGAPGTTW